MTQVIALDTGSPGRIFDGVGALSAGASSRLLIDYPEPQRSRVLDYLFRPGHGAALQILRVEIGGDTNSTAGSEPSHMRRPDEIVPDRGYEWWLMHEARKRNPAIVLAGLAWGAPGWFDGGFWSQDNVDYHVAWLDCARRQGLSIDYLGGWNESEDFDPQWFVALNKAMVARGHPDTGIIAADGWGDDLAERWKVADAMAADSAFCDAVDVVAVHYPCGQQYNGAPYDHGPSTEVAKGLGKPLWSGEQGAQRPDIGAGPLAKAINRSYIDGAMTATVNWALVASYYSSVQGGGVGLMRAYEPWSGYFEPSRSLWAVAHTTQFASPGWRYLDGGCGYLHDGGSFVTLCAPGGGDVSVVVETVDAQRPQQLRLELGEFVTRSMQVWATDLRSTRYDDWFREAASPARVGDGVELTLEPGRLYTVTTTSGQGKASPEPAAGPRSMPLPYVEDFESTPLGRTPPLLSDFNAAFEVAPCPDGRPGQCVEQTVTTPPIEWRYGVPSVPLTLLGDPNWWGDYVVTVAARVGEAPYVELLGRVDGVFRGAGGQGGYRLRLHRDGRWELIESGPNRAEVSLASGVVAEFDPAGWHRLGLSFRGAQVTVLLNDEPAGFAADDRHNRGQVGLAVGDWSRAQFDDLAIAATAPTPVLISRDDVRASATSWQLGHEPDNVLTANPSTMWLSSQRGSAPDPHSITLDFGRRKTAAALLYTPRFDGNPAGNITAHTVYLSRDGVDFTAVAAGSWATTTATKVAALPPDEFRFLRLEAGPDNEYAGAAGLAVVEAWR
ncbi:discoidin domain-containing protein [Haloactinopolyspora sp.]|uniref:discoidin domain-containing protein n=1 Tax=Haloactinopolyspora sp. TaxID=1966353 RepID=UPI00261CA4B0|nr:discoidin domain-containing protein [Haloactinopolyspora sp.]